MAGPARTQQTTPANKPNKRPTSPVRLIALVCLALIVIVGLAILITWLAIKPKKLQYSVDEAWISNYNLTNNGKLTSKFNFVIRTYNANHKASVYYDKIEVTVSYHGHTVATDTVQPFFQPRRNVTRFLFQNTARDVALPSRTVHHLKVDRTGGEVNLDIDIKAKIRFKVGIWKSRHYKLKALCSPVVVNLSNVRKFKKTPCDVDI